jgi:Ulp1 family protease
MMLRSLSYISTAETERINRAVNVAHPSSAAVAISSYMGEQLRNGNNNVLRHFIYPRNLSTLRPRQLVDDIVLDAYMAHLTSRDEYLSEQQWLSKCNTPNPPPLRRKNVVFNSFFLTHLLAASNNDVSQWQYMKGQMFSGTCKLCFM